MLNNNNVFVLLNKNYIWKRRILQKLNKYIIQIICKYLHRLFMSSKLFFCYYFTKYIYIKLPLYKNYKINILNYF